MKAGGREQEREALGRTREGGGIKKTGGMIRSSITNQMKLTSFDELFPY